MDVTHLANMHVVLGVALSDWTSLADGKVDGHHMGHPAALDSVAEKDPRALGRDAAR